MKTITIGSYYQLHKHPDHEPFDEDTQQKLITLCDSKGMLLVSQENLALAHEIMGGNITSFKSTSALPSRFSDKQFDYLTALFCDIEVALQERKIIALADKLGFAYIIDNRLYHPLLQYNDNLPSTDEVDLTTEQLIDGDVYVINTHGKAQEIDGPYDNAINSALEIQRIVVDACSSAASSFPTRHSGNKSVLQMIANATLKKYPKSAPQNLEIVGYTDKFDTTSKLTEYAIFSKSPEEQTGLRLLTLKQHQNNIKQELYKSTLAEYGRLSQQASIKPEEKVKEALISVLSHAASTLVTKLNLSGHTESAERLEKLNALSGPEASLCLDDAKSNTKPDIKQLRKELKEKRKAYINALDPDKLIHSAAEAIAAFENNNGKDTNFVTAISVLELATQDYKREVTTTSISTNEPTSSFNLN